MKFLKTLFFACSIVTASAQPQLVVRPSAATTPLGFDRKKAQIFIRDPLNIKVFDWETASLTTLQLPGMQMSETSMDGRLTAFGSMDDAGFQVLIIDNETRQSKIFTGKGDLMGLHISPDNQYIAVESEQVVTLYSFAQGKQSGTYTKKQEENNSCSFNNRNLLVLGKKELEVLNLPDLKVVERIPLKGDFGKFINNGRFYIIGSNIYDSNSKQLFGQTASGVPFPYDNTPLISPDGKQVAVFYNLGKFFFAVYDLTTGKELWKKDLSKDIGDMMSAMFFQVDPAWRFFAIANKSNGVTLFDLKTGDEKCQIFSISPEDILIKIPNGHYMATRRGAFEGVNFEQDGQIFDFAQFDAQFNRPDLVLAHIGLSPPTVIDAFSKAYERRLQRIRDEDGSVSNQDFKVPNIQFVKELPIFTDKTNVEVSILATHEKDRLDRLNIYVNGTPFYGKNGHAIKGQKAKEYKHTQSLTLVPGDNRIEVEVLSQKKARSQRIQSIVRCEAPEVRPNLHVVTIGVSAYTDKRKNLLYAAEDASDIHDFFAGKNDLYGKVIQHKLWETDFSKQNLKKIKQALLQSKETDCIVVFYAGHGVVDPALNYYLGNTGLNFSNPSNNGIPYHLVEDLLDSVPARQRLLMLDACFSGEIDKRTATRIKIENTEHGIIRFRSSDAGLALGNSEEERIFNLMREWFADLHPNSGATVLSSAGGQQTAAEGEQWKNGVFTWCLLNGLRDRKADVNKDGKIMLSEVRDYLETAVPAQTNRQQQPTFRTENLVVDWQIW